MASGISPGLIRLSAGIEDVQDLIADLTLGFAAVGAIS
ncbi:PLP-dependent transferase [Actinoplanes sp. NPDC051851]